MAAATATIAVLYKGVIAPEKIPGSDEWTPYPTAKPLRIAIVSVTFDTGDYAAGGVACNLLAALTGWTRIGSAAGGAVMMNTSAPTLFAFSDQNSGTTGNRKVALNVLATGAAHAASALTAETIYATVIGY